MDEEGNRFPVALFGKNCIVGGNILSSTKTFYLHTIVGPGECGIVRIDTGTVLHFLITYREFLWFFLKAAGDNTVLANKELATIWHRSLL